MNKTAITLTIFCISSLIIILFILLKPTIKIKFKKNEFSFSTYFIGAVLGTVSLLAFTLINFDDVINGLKGKNQLKPLGILILFFSMVFISIYLDTTGFFEFCARYALQKSGGSGTKLFIVIYITVSILTLFTSNDIVILTFTPFIYYFTIEVDIDPIPYLISEFYAANTWSMSLLIGNPTNILLGTAFSISFFQYFKWMIFPTIFAGIANFFLLYFVFKKKISFSILRPSQQEIKPLEAIKTKKGAILGLLFLLITVILLAISPTFKVEMWIVSAVLAGFLLLILIIKDLYLKFASSTPKESKTFSLPEIARRLPWLVIPFVLCLFITVEGLRKYGIPSSIGGFFSRIANNDPKLIFLYGYSSSISANILNNIPMSVAFSGILEGHDQLSSVFSTIIGSNLGANLSPIGALAGIMWMSILRQKNVPLTFWKFTLYGLLMTPVTILICLSVLAIEFLIIN
ncbi:transporter arsb-related [Anaeramoeba ignava]|uniref:Transporter arsb-related n=1 Tax=Anaeramoeba ignava TaxID=1746090 RepID=A0A9Q0RAX5_ANAIG|nr:transporter arsb-related [Anaeramoeba ignava]